MARLSTQTSHNLPTSFAKLWQVMHNTPCSLTGLNDRLSSCMQMHPTRGKSEHREKSSEETDLKPKDRFIGTKAKENFQEICKRTAKQIS